MDQIELKNGMKVFVRPLGAEDGPRLEAAYGLLSEETKYQRFLGPKPFLSPREISYLTDVDGHNHVALAATLGEDPDRIIAVGRFVRLPDDPTAAEFAIVVGDPYQGQGIGSALLARLADIATEQGIERVTATMLAENVPAHRLMRRLATDWHVPGRIVELTVQQHSSGPTDEVEVSPLAA